MKKMFMTAALALGLVIPSAALAATSMMGGDVTLPKGDNRVGTYYAAGQTVTIDGNVDGDVICAGQTVIVNGSVNGDVICAGQEVTINGAVAGSVRAVGQAVTINSVVGRNVTTAGQTVTLGSASRVNGEMAVAGQSVTINGPVGHDVVAAVNDMQLGSTIGGSLNYLSKQALAIDRSKVKGAVVHQLPPRHEDSQTSVMARLSSLLFGIASGLVIALVAVWLAPKLVRGMAHTMITRPGASIGWGALVAIAAPVVAVALAFTIIGLPLAILMGILWAMTIMMAGLFAGVAVGQLALGRKEASQKHLALSALTGIPLVLIINWVPFVGFLATLGVTAWTLGAVALNLNRMRALG